jgi:threonine dehydrogenase-like Zn-dependent dehydrogenase
MKAVVLHEADAMRVEQRPVPEPGPGEVLLKVNVTSICGTDVKVLHRHSARVRGWTITPSHFLNNQLDTVWLAEP